MNDDAMFKSHCGGEFTDAPACTDKLGLSRVTVSIPKRASASNGWQNGASDL